MQRKKNVLDWLLGFALVLTANSPSLAADALPAASFEAGPAAGHGPLVVLFSGSDGYGPYIPEAKAFAKEGFFTVLFDSTLFSFGFGEPSTQTGTGDMVKGVIERSLKKPEVQSKKAAVVGYSRGGHIALFYANRIPDLVSAVVAYYPTTFGVTEANVKDRLSAPRLGVPTLVLAGVYDSFKNCCVIDRARLIQRTAALPDIAVPVELHEYPYTDHVFNIGQYPRNYRPREAEDAFNRTLDHIRKFASKP